jgi:acyl-CoA thioester hydrolase
MPHPRRKKGGYFDVRPGTPDPLTVCCRRRVSFSEVDPLSIMWHGRYPSYFEDANEALGRRCGLSYADFRDAGVLAPIVQFHVDYFDSPLLGEEVSIIGRMIWTEAARIDIEYEIRKENGSLAAAGYTVQMLVTAEGETLVAPPPLLTRCRERWAEGDFSDMQ